MKPLAEIAFAVGVTVVVVMLAYALWSLLTWLTQRLCSHTRVWEDGACNARCRDCGKNLGLIGTWRKNPGAPRTTKPTDGAADQH